MYIETGLEEAGCGMTENTFSDPGDICDSILARRAYPQLFMLCLALRAEHLNGMHFRMILYL